MLERKIVITEIFIAVTALKEILITNRVNDNIV